MIKLALAVSFVVLVYYAWTAQGGDFPVFWRAGRDLFEGLPIYNWSRDGSQCFKYPPWIAPLFLPFSFFPMEWAGRIWRLISVAALFITLRLFKPLQKQSGSIFVSFLLFWGIWNFNLLSGQITLLQLMLALWANSLLRKAPRLGTVILSFVLSVKIFHFYAWLGSRYKIHLLKNAFVVLGVFVLAALPTLDAFHWNIQDLVGEFMKTSASSGENLGGAMNGLPSQMIHLTGLDPHSLKLRILGFLLSGAVGWLLVRRCAPSIQFYSALAVASAIHPLAFSYGFALAFPVGVLAIDKAFDNRKQGKIPSSLGLALTGLVFAFFPAQRSLIIFVWIYVLGEKGQWRARYDSNVRPSAPEADALSN